MSLRELFQHAEKLRQLQNTTRDEEFLYEAISAYERADDLIQRLGMFSVNETLDDIVTTELCYFLSRYHVACLLLQQSDISDRNGVLMKAKRAFRSFLSLCMSYELVPGPDSQMCKEVLSASDEEYDDGRVRPSSSDRREAKIQRYRNEKLLGQMIARLSDGVNPSDETARTLNISIIHLAISRTLHELEYISSELAVLRAAPAVYVRPLSEDDPLQRQRQPHEDWRLDQKRSLLDSRGKVLKPFVIRSNRESLNKGVFQAGHSLPSMSIDEYLELERARGGILDPAEFKVNSQNDAVNNDNDEALEELRRKAIEWDEFTDINTKGIGNTMNRG